MPKMFKVVELKCHQHGVGNNGPFNDDYDTFESAKKRLEKIKQDGKQFLIIEYSNHISSEGKVVQFNDTNIPSLTSLQ